MSDDATDAPITTLVVDGNPFSSAVLGSPPPWNAPFIELLGFLKVIDNSKVIDISKVINRSQLVRYLDGQRFCFQPSRDLSKISKIFLSVSTPSAKYDIDLETIRLSGSGDVPPAAIKLREYANRVLQRVKRFRDDLSLHGVLNDSACFLRFDLLTCPICCGRLLSCVGCDSKIACSNRSCLGFLVIDCEQCYDHRRMACHACLAKNNTLPYLARCPTCQRWQCREETDWCVGLVIRPAPGTEEFLKLSREWDWDNEAIVRSHPPKPSSCEPCMSGNPSLGWAKCCNISYKKDSGRCPSHTPLLVKLYINSGQCPDCVSQCPGRECACKSFRTCDMCLAVQNNFSSDPRLVTCPGCGVNYCIRPSVTCDDYIQFCRGCKGVILCRDCEEEEGPPRTIQTDQELPKRVELALRCTDCLAWNCRDCHLSEHTAGCCYCSEWYCRECVAKLDVDVITQCPRCNLSVCGKCLGERGHRGCPSDVLESFKSFWILQADR